MNALIILDGFGYNPDEYGNAVKQAKTPFFDSLMKKYPHTLINASGYAVGLPEGQMGNSEVGHLNLGAGRVVYQDITTIDDAIKNGTFDQNPAFKKAIDAVLANDSTLHLVGLLSNGGVHSMNTHLYALLALCKKRGVKNVCVHAITDGRDVPPDSGRGFLRELSDKMNEIGVGTIATIVGRYYYMDRDNRWERVERGYNAVFAASGKHFSSADSAIASSYAAGTMDEFVEPMVIGDYHGVNDGDAMIFYNFRADRARQISRAITEPQFTNFERMGGHKKITYVGMTQYDVTLNNIETAFPPRHLKNTLGEYLAVKGYTQARVAETEKYAHVTFFFNGGVEQPNENETRVLVASPKVATYDLKPEMSAYEVAEKAVEQAESGKDVLILNFANCDMVGHTGVLHAAVKAVEAVDECLKTVIEAVWKTGGTVIVTADHGNSEVMMFDSGSPCTSHTTNPVPLIVAGDKYVGKKLKSGKALCDVAPTLLDIMGVEKPAEMTGESIIEK
ncbi:MAG: 2,3-bisphosphoglycerate-independent phosphoglycerate mutase [Clostridiales bacterium]|nr:2,3-bisphosphoglycerate-independent phosphoglycerate mutase [Clostridiales bacterium]